MRKSDPNLNPNDLLDMLKNKDSSDAGFLSEPEVPKNAPTILDALELEMKNAKITDEKPTSPEKPEKSAEISEKPKISKSKNSKKEPVSKPMIIEEVTEPEKTEIEPKHKIDNSNSHFFKVSFYSNLIHFKTEIRNELSSKLNFFLSFFEM